ncbi:DUF4382 domain-containing protein [Halarchaeum nitratireducens]|uniref:DUF4382 domain-containing protein n=1 Tax=Halarchaeum nitratireducens TaxID=489913 RepID=A0A830G9L2_9EURY|nr:MULTISPECIES: DUF4382 domain-containing protein [Halarchaeum]MBP2250186.1 hypothetical protein [Halarchaeum solikamskense]GGN11777.1 hypothetical protein GCM10009021_09700 [Halarchaeum nitratireducens]
MNRQGLLAVCLVALVVLAGCAGGPGGGTTSTTSDDGGATSTTSDGGTSGSGTVVTYLSDRPAAIDDFAHLNATVTRVGLHRVSAAGNESDGANATAGGWQTVDVNETVDLTELRGENATHIVNQSVPSGTYDNVFVYVSDVNGTLTDGSSAAVKLPSGKLHLATTFTVEANRTVDFVYDLAVHGTGNGRYIVRPNAGESGADQPLRVVGDGGTSANASASADVDLAVTQNDGANASESVNLTVAENVSAEGESVTSGNETTTAGAGANATVEATAAATAGDA